MAKKGINDKILERMLELNGKVSARIRLNLKGVAPFASKPIPAEDLIYARNTIGFLDIQQLISEFGEDKVNGLMYDIVMMENRRKKSGSIPMETPQRDLTLDAELGGFPLSPQVF